MKFTLLLAALAFIPQIGLSQTTNPKTKEDAFALGQEMAACSAFFRYSVGIAKRAHKPAVEKSFGDYERGWKLAAMYMLRMGAENPSHDANATVNFISDTQLNRFSAMEELDPSGKSIVQWKSQNCDPITPWQEAIIQDLRSRAR